MKKLISSLSLFLLFSCGLISQEDVVVNVEEFKKGRYEVETERYFFYTDSVYKVGDTLKIGKKDGK